MSDDIRVGDRFLVEVEVTGIDNPRSVATRVQGIDSGKATWFTTSELRAGKRLQRAIKVGDRVRYLGATSFPPGIDTVIAIHGDLAWVSQEGSNWVVKIANLALVGDAPS